MAGLGFNFHPSSPDLIGDVEAYFAEYSIQRDAAIALRDGDVDVDLEGDEDEALIVITEPAAPVPPSELPSGAKAVFLAAVALGWQPTTWRFLSHVEPVLFKETTEEHNAGTIRFPAHDFRNYVVVAKDPAGRLGFDAAWRGEGPKLTGAFIEAKVRDPLGLFVENYFEYKVKTWQILLLGKRNATERAARMNYEYNDGSQHVENTVVMKQTTPFLAWIDEWLGMKAPDHKTLSKKAKATVAFVNEDDLDGGLAAAELGEWSAE